ncbi:MAG: glucose-1-phosphate thymidylyltransferase RfbA [Rhodobacteraceae bacterium]|nr:glucose-1-phosphate thymidylyltransferase RfbA [Paracoccaceae bacterium]
MTINRRKGIILAGGSGTRLYPITHMVSKQLLPLYDKPMVYYPLSVLMLSHIREVAIISTPRDLPLYRELLGDGSQWGMSFEFIEQPTPDGLAQAYLLAEKFLDGAPSALVLGDNVFFGEGLSGKLKAADARASGGTVFGYQVSDPERYGVVEFDKDNKVLSIIEKPEKPKSNFAVTGIYFLDGDAPKLARQVKPSPRGELEITDLLNLYREVGKLTVERLGRGYAWLDTGTHDSLLEAADFIRTIEKRQNLKVSCPEEIAYLNGWITRAQLLTQAEPYLKTQYGQYLKRVADPG